MGGVQLMHAGEEGLLVLIPLAVVLYLDRRNRRRQKQREAAAESGPEKPAAAGAEATPD
ncbi:MAG TPA: hypothetical protein VM754_00770 [Actinomycetota bacterium]|nr:hypothetical protein [Actinomycetota bacterium]